MNVKTSIEEDNPISWCWQHFKVKTSKENCVNLYKLFDYMNFQMCLCSNACKITCFRQKEMAEFKF